MSTRAHNLHVKLEQLSIGGSQKPFHKIEDGYYLSDRPEDIKNQSLIPKTEALASFDEHAPERHYPALKSRLWMPIHDRPPFPGIKWLGMAVDYIENAHDVNGWSILVNCKAGISRSAMVTIAYFMRRDDLPLERAALMVAKSRPIVPIEAFIEGLVEWEDFLK